MEVEGQQQLVERRGVDVGWCMVQCAGGAKVNPALKMNTVSILESMRRILI